MDKSTGREGEKSVCQNFKNDPNMIKVLFCLCFDGDRVSIIGISSSNILKGFDVHSYDYWLNAGQTILLLWLYYAEPNINLTVWMFLPYKMSKIDIN